MKGEINRILEILEGAKDETGCVPMALVRQALKKLEQRWIPLKEREPKEEGEYLVSFDDGFIATTGYYEGDFELWADAGEPIAWMPLPEPYKGEE